MRRSLRSTPKNCDIGPPRANDDGDDDDDDDDVAAVVSVSVSAGGGGWMDVSRARESVLRKSPAS